MDANLDELAPVGPLTEWLDAHVPQLGKGPLTTELLSGGTSNVVLTIKRGANSMVLRRPPAVPPPGAEKGVLREARVLTALRDTEVPAPYCYGSCDDSDVIGSPFYVMEKVDGWAPNLRGEKIYNVAPFDKMPYEYGIAYAIVGGRGTMLGPVVGTGLLVWSSNLFSSKGEYSAGLFGLLIIVVVTAAPSGLVGTIHQFFKAIRRRLSVSADLPTNSDAATSQPIKGGGP